MLVQGEVETVALDAAGGTLWRVAHRDVIAAAELLGGNLALTGYGGAVAVLDAADRTEPARVTGMPRPSSKAVDERWTPRCLQTPPSLRPALTCRHPRAYGQPRPEGAREPTNGHDRITAHVAWTVPSGRCLLATGRRTGHSPQSTARQADGAGLMIGPLLVLTGLLFVLAGWLLLRQGGEGWRIGRLLAAAPQRSLAEARAMAARGEQAYVRLHGRIDSAEEFPGDDDTPLVFRRRQLQRLVPGALRGSRWQTFDDERAAVPFDLVERGERVSIDVEALGDGLVVVPRVSRGVAADLAAATGDGLPHGMAADTPVALRIEQVSSTDHATACGVPRLSEAGETIVGPGLRRPLILTTLEPSEAMRILGAHRRRSLLVAAGLLAAGPLVAAGGLLVVLLGR